MTDPRLTQPWETPGPRILAVETLLTAPEGFTFLIVKVTTDVDGLYGLGCGTYSYRAHAIAAVIDLYLAPRIIGRSAEDITDIFHALRLSGIWRNGAIENSALSGIDLALWDLKGKLADRPVWALAGGRVRHSLRTYRSVFATTLEQLVDRTGEMLAAGETALRPVLQDPDGGVPFWGRGHADAQVDSMRVLREVFGDTPDLIVDIHGKLTPSEAVELAVRLEPFRPFYYEDPLRNEDLDWYRRLRLATTMPLATGEQFTNPAEVIPLLASRSIDVLRCHISTMGGYTSALGLARVAEAFGVGTAWHGPADLSPIGLAANAALGLTSPTFVIHEHHAPNDATREVFPGTLESSGGLIEGWRASGWGIDFDERAAARHPPLAPEDLGILEMRRRPDRAIHAM